MKAVLLRYVNKIDALQPRERIIAFCAAAALVVAAADTLLLEPLLAKQKQLGQQVAKDQALMAAAHKQLDAAAKGAQVDPDAENRRRLQDLRQRMVEADAALKEQGPRMVAPDQMARLLEDLLGKNRGLRLVAMRSLPAKSFDSQPVSPNGPAKPAAADASSQAKAPSGGVLYQHGLEITVQGRYEELLQYLTMLEALPWRMYWGDAHFTVVQYPQAVFSFTIFTLSADPKWLSV